MHFKEFKISFGQGNVMICRVSSSAAAFTAIVELAVERPINRCHRSCAWGRCISPSMYARAVRAMCPQTPGWNCARKPVLRSLPMARFITACINFVIIAFVSYAG